MRLRLLEQNMNTKFTVTAVIGDRKQALRAVRDVLADLNHGRSIEALRVKEVLDNLPWEFETDQTSFTPIAEVEKERIERLLKGKLTFSATLSKTADEQAREDVEAKSEVERNAADAWYQALPPEHRHHVDVIRKDRIARA